MTVLLMRKKRYRDRLLSTQRGSLIGYWPLSEPSGTTIQDASGSGRTGTYSGVTLGATGIGDGRTAATFDGTTGYGNVQGASFAAAFTGQLFTVALWAKVSAAGVWSDTTQDRALVLQSDGNNRLLVQKPVTANQIQVSYTAGATAKSSTKSTFSPTGWFHLAVTVTKAGDAMIFYVDGVAQATVTALGTYAGALTSSIIGASDTTPTLVWSGSLAHVAVWSSVLTGAEIARLAVAGG